LIDVLIIGLLHLDIETETTFGISATIELSTVPSVKASTLDITTTETSAQEQESNILLSNIEATRYAEHYKVHVCLNKLNKIKYIYYSCRILSITIWTKKCQARL